MHLRNVLPLVLLVSATAVAAQPPLPMPRKIASDSDVQLWSSGAYVYDGAGDITAIGADSYAYDRVRRVTSAATSGHAQAFTYDAFGNLTTITTDGTTLDANIDVATNRMLSSSTSAAGATAVAVYDAAGNVRARDGIFTYDYDALAMMTALTGPAQDEVYVYGVGDERIATVSAAHAAPVWSWTIRDAARVLRRFEQSGGQWTWREDYVYRDGAVLAAVVGGETRHFHLDHLGSPRVTTADSGRVVARHAYYPYGREIGASDDAERLRFTGHERDASLDYMHARYYDAPVGRFLSADPKLEPDHAVHEPQTWNRYAYVSGNPIVLVDPDGKSYLEFDGVRHELRLYSQNGTLLGTWSASNHPQNAVSIKPLKKGSYKVDKADQKTPHLHPNKTTTVKTLVKDSMVPVLDANNKPLVVDDDSRQGRYGTYGIIRIDVPGHSGIGVHSGRDGVTDGYGGSDWAYTTSGCIRTSDVAMKAITTTMKNDPLTRVDVVARDERHWLP